MYYNDRNTLKIKQKYQSKKTNEIGMVERSEREKRRKHLKALEDFYSKKLKDNLSIDFWESFKIEEKNYVYYEFSISNFGDDLSVEKFVERIIKKFSFRIDEVRERRLSKLLGNVS